MFLFITFCIILFIQTFYYLFLFGKFSFSKPSNNIKKTVPVSIIICAKNEADNLKQFLPYIAKQIYPVFEIVLVNDASTDNSLKVMQDFKEKYASQNIFIKIITATSKQTLGKKEALQLGIRTAKYNHLLLTDADCKPISTHWIQEMTTCFSKQKSIILGYGAYQKIKNSFLNKIIRFETLLTAIQYFSYAKAKMPYMGVGRNIAYTKDLFFKTTGFNNHLNIPSGDDDLFIQQASNQQNTAVCFSEKSFTISQSKTNLNEWIQQKRRHITTSNHYKLTHKILLSVFFLSQLLFWLLAILLLFLQINLALTGILIAFRFLIWYIIIYKFSKQFLEKDLIVFAPIFEISLIFMLLYISVKNIFSPLKQW